jgi:hypothetical protein
MNNWWICGFSIQQRLCYLSSIIAHSLKMLNIIKPLPFLNFRTFKKKICAIPLLNILLFKNWSSVDGIWGMERVTLPRRRRISTRLHGVRFQSLCACAYVCIIYNSADVRCVCVQCKNIFAVMRLRFYFSLTNFAVSDFVVCDASLTNRDVWTAERNGT